ERVLLRIVTAGVLGAVLGYEGEKAGKPRGFPSLIIVFFGTATVFSACAVALMDMDGLSRVIQGVVTGIGFIGAGSILKLSEERDIQGLTTAAGLWVTAAHGVSLGVGHPGAALSPPLFS